MEKQAENLMIENISKNMSDADEYPAMMSIHSRCVSILANLWGVQKGEKAIGTATTGTYRLSANTFWNESAIRP